MKKKTKSKPKKVAKVKKKAAPPSSKDTAELGVALGCFDGPDEDGWYYTAGGTPFSPEDL